MAIENTSKERPSILFTIWSFASFLCPLTTAVLLHQEDLLPSLLPHILALLKSLIPLICRIFLSFFLVGFLAYFYRQNQKSSGLLRLRVSFVFGLKAGSFGVASGLFFAALKRVAYYLAQALAQ